MNAHTHDSDAALHRLRSILRRHEHLLVAFSGGVDSTLLLRVASDLPQVSVCAATVVCPLFPSRDTQRARTLARGMNVDLIEVPLDPLSDTRVAANPPDRCYWCKRLIFGRLCAIARQRTIPRVCDGANRDDRDDYRPGSRAARELGVESPLQEAGLRKADIRRYSRDLDLPTWDQPSQACLASRVASGITLSVAVLRRIDAAEQFLRDQGFSLVRVRHLGSDEARIEVDEKEIPRLDAPELWATVLARLTSLGYTCISIDRLGYRTGSMNRPGKTA